MAKFVEFYGKFARNVNIIFLILANLALIMGITISMVYKQKVQEKMRLLHNDRHSFRSQYTVAIVISIILSVCWLLLSALPYFTINIHYVDPATISESDVNTMRAIYGVANALFIVTFVTQQFATQQGPSDEELEPESDDDGIETSDEEGDTETYIDDGATQY